VLEREVASENVCAVDVGALGVFKLHWSIDGIVVGVNIETGVRCLGFIFGVAYAEFEQSEKEELRFKGVDEMEVGIVDCDSMCEELGIESIERMAELEVGIESMEVGGVVDCEFDLEVVVDCEFELELALSGRGIKFEVDCGEVEVVVVVEVVVGCGSDDVCKRE
jgi:hypothetical protein